MWTTLQPPGDAISCVRFNSQDLLLCSSWDKSLRILDTAAGSCLARFELKAPVLSCAWMAGQSSGKVFAGGAERRVTLIDVATGVMYDIGGEHRKPISSLAFNKEANALVTGSFDNSLQLIDCRANAEHQITSLGLFYDVGAKVYSVDTAGNYVVAALAGSNVNVYDIRKVSQPLSVRHYDLNHPLRAVRCNIDGSLFAVSSVGSRVMVEETNEGMEAQTPALQRPPHVPKDFESLRFRAHRYKDELAEGTAMPIHALAFHPIKQELATGGSDQTVKLWNLESRKLVQTYTDLRYSVVSLDYSNGGTKLAVALSEDRYCQTPIASESPQRSALIVRSD